jgi:hypothetical protein
MITLAGGITSLIMLKRLADKYALTRPLYRSHQAILVLIMVLFLFI